MAKQSANTQMELMGFCDSELTNPEHDKIIKWVDSNAEDVVLRLIGDGFIEDLRTHHQTWDDNFIRKEEERANRYVAGRILSLRGLIQEAETEIRKISSSIRGDKLQLISRVRADAEQMKRELAVLESWDGPGPLPAYVDIIIHRRVWERPVYSKHGKYRRDIGYIDLEIEYSFPVITLCLPTDMVSEWDMKTGPTWDVSTGGRLTLCIEAKTKIKTLGELFRQINMYRSYTDCEFAVVCPDDAEVETIRSQGIGFIKYTPASPHCRGFL